MKRVIVLLAIALVLSVVFFPAQVNAGTYNNMVYTDNGDGTCTITNYLTTGGTLNIPDTMDGLTVTKIGYMAFRGKSLTGVTLPSTLKYIGKDAFYDNFIPTIDIPNSVTYIGETAFARNMISSFTYPSGITTIPYGLFMNNSFSTVTIPSQITDIGGAAFANNAILVTLDLNSNLKSIGRQAFSDCALPNLFIPGNVDYIGKYAFSACDINNLIIEDGVKVIDNHAFRNCKIASLTLPNSVTYAGQYAFAFNTMISAVLSDNLTFIDQYAFAFNPALSGVVMPANLKFVAYRAFNNTGVSPATLPNTIEFIGRESFSSSVTLPVGTGTWKDEFGGNYNAGDTISVAFAYCHRTSTEFTYSDNGNGTCMVHKYMGGLPNLVIPNTLGGLTVTGIGYEAFDSVGLFSAVIPDSVTLIEDGAFSYNNLSSVVLPLSLERIESDAFRYNSISSLSPIPDGVTYMDENIFMNNIIGAFGLPAPGSLWLENGVTLKNGGSVALLTADYERVNAKPNRKAGVNATGDTATVSVGSAYTLDLATIFEDIDGDALTYQVSVDSATYTAAAQSYSYTPTASGDTVLLFRALDNEDYSTDTYEVTVTATNNKPVRKSGVNASDDELVKLNATETLDLSTIFEDSDSDPLTYEVKIDSGSYTAVTGSTYTYPSSTAGTSTHVFRAHDGKEYSTDTYTVNLTVVEFDFTDNGDGTCTVTNYLGSDTNVTIPNTLDSLTVTDIGEAAFRGDGLTAVSIPSTVEFIGKNAFRENSLSSVTLPSSLTSTGKNIFMDNSLTSISFPTGLSRIQDAAFRGNNITTLVIPSTVTRIDASAFRGNGMTTLTIPTSVTRIDGAAFNDNALVTLNGSASDGIIYARKSDGTDDTSTIVSYGGTANVIDFIAASVTNISGSAFIDNGITAVTIPEGVTNIGSSAFRYNSLATVDIPSTVISIGKKAFKNNTLTTFMLPAGSGEWTDTDSLVHNGGDSVATTPGYSRINQKPVRQSGVDAAVNEETVQNTPYTVLLSDIFEDGNSDAMTYEVNIDGAGYVSAAEDYSYPATATGTFVLLFRAHDGYEYSDDTYEVTLTVWGNHTITYDANGGTGSDSTMHMANTTVTLHDGTGFTQTGYVIDGWTLDTTDYMLGDLYDMVNNDITAYAVWAKDTDEDGVSDDDEDLAGTDKNDPNSKPATGDAYIKVYDEFGDAVAGMTCVLNSAPVVVVTDADGIARFIDINLSQHTLSLRDGTTQVGTYTLDFARGSSNATVITDDGAGDSVGSASTTTTNTFLSLTLNIQYISSNWQLTNAAVTAQETRVTNPNTGDNSSNSMYLLPIPFVLLGGLLIRRRKLR